MNSLNDLIQSHEMYDPAHIPPPVRAPEEYVAAPPPVAPREIPIYHHPPQPERVAPPSYYHTPSYPPETYYPAPAPPHRTYRAYDRETIHAMMREITQLQERLRVLLSSCEAMIERTYISHEYHHIARYSEHLHHRAAHHGYTVPAPHSSPAPVPLDRDALAPNRQEPPSVYRETETPHIPTPEPLSIKEGVFDGTNMISADGDMYAIPTDFVYTQQLIEGDILQAMVFATGQIQYKLSEPTSREHIMGILSTHAGTAPHYIVQTAHKAYKVLCEAIEASGATPGKQVLLIVPTGGASEWAAIERVFE